jgi:hypothetical protein
LRWTVSVAAGKTSTITYTYTLERPANWQLWQ